MKVTISDSSWTPTRREHQARIMRAYWKNRKAKDLTNAPTRREVAKLIRAYESRLEVLRQVSNDIFLNRI